MFDLSSFIEANQHPSISTDSTGSMLSLNESAAQMLDLNKNEWEGKNITAFLPAVQELFTARQKAADSFQVVQKLENKEGVSRYAGIRSFTLVHDKELYYWFVLDPKEAHHLEVDKIRERYQLAVEAGHTGIWDYSFEDNHLIADESLKNLLGYKAEERIDDDFFWERLIAGEDRAELKHAIEANIRQGKTYFEETFRMVHRQRVLLWVLGRGKIFYRKGQPYRIICSVTDITDRREASEQLRKTLINFKAIFDAFPDLFFRVDRIGDFLEIMAGEYADFGIANIRDFEGRNIREAFPESEYLKLYDCLQQTFESRSVEKCEYRLKVNNRKKYYEARMIAITGNEAIGIVRDITDSVKINRELFSAKRTAEEALNARDSFFSMMSHEMRTPLNIVIGMIYLLLEKDPRADQLKFIHTMKFSADNLLSLINDLLDFSKIKAGKIVFERSDFNLPEIIQNIYNSYKLQMDSSMVNVILEIDEDLPTLVHGDAKRLSQILNNLLSNAQKFTASGEIFISVRQNKATAENTWIEFRVRDSGIGIPEKRIKDIFKPFEQGEPDTSRKYGGTGLGLTIVKQLVELQNGTLEVKSSPGKGSTFMIIIPFGKQKTAAGAVEERNKIGEGIKQIESLNILYADDINSNLFLMKGYADLWKFNLDTANNGKQALDLFREKTYDLILLDLQMPGLNGFEIAREMREIEGSIGIHTPIIAVTGDISVETVKQVYTSGMDDYLYKPVNPKLMLEKIGRWQQQVRSDQSMLNPEEKAGSGIEISDNHVLQFQQVDYLYEEAPEQYAQYLGQLSKEFRENMELIRIALIEENYDEFRRIRHSMKSNMKLLKMFPLQALLEEIKEKFSLSQLPPAGGIYYTRLEKMIGRILKVLDLKLAVISG
jgi:PAS domain S-box-containing protein